MKIGKMSEEREKLLIKPRQARQQQRRKMLLSKSLSLLVLSEKFFICFNVNSAARGKRGRGEAEKKVRLASYCH